MSSTGYQQETEAWSSVAETMTETFPATSPNDDPWRVVYDQMAEPDLARCRVWQEEVQNLLIFAGLFSAVVTAFVVESCKDLREDPTEKAALILLQILAQLEGNGTAAPVLEPFVATASTTRVNSFWFLSLILSLSTVLAGTVCLQWLREHLRLPSDPREAFPLHHMQIQSLDRWYVQHIFTALPILLQASVILFLIGIVDLLQPLDKTVMIVALTGVMGAILFYIVTTIAPAVQDFSLYFKFSLPANKTPRSPCPYLSPQSLLFLRFWFLILGWTKVLTYFFSWRYWKPFIALDLFFSRRVNRSSWSRHRRDWLLQRDMDILLSQPGHNISVWVHTNNHVPLYDTVVGLSASHFKDSTRIASLFCRQQYIEDLERLSEPRSGGNFVFSTAHHFVLCLLHGIDLKQSQYTPYPHTPSSLRHFTTYMFCQNSLEGDLPPKVREYFEKLLILLLRASFLGDNAKPEGLINPELQRKHLRTFEFLPNSSQSFENQSVYLMESFFQNAAGIVIEPAEIEGTGHLSDLTIHFIQIAGQRIASMRLARGIHSGEKLRRPAYYETANFSIQSALDSGQPSSLLSVAYLVTTVSLYLATYFRVASFKHDNIETFVDEARDLLLAIRLYREKCKSVSLSEVVVSGNEQSSPLQYLHALQKRIFSHPDIWRQNIIAKQPSAHFDTKSHWWQYLEGMYDTGTYEDRGVGNADGENIGVEVVVEGGAVDNFELVDKEDRYRLETVKIGEADARVEPTR